MSVRGWYVNLVRPGARPPRFQGGQIGASRGVECYTQTLVTAIQATLETVVPAVQAVLHIVHRNYHPASSVIGCIDKEVEGDFTRSD